MKRIICSNCGKNAAPYDAFIVDGRILCSACLFPGMKPVTIFPVGFVRSDYDPETADPEDVVSRIELLQTQEPFLFRIEDESVITVVFYMNRIQEFRTRVARRYDGKETGVYASRSPSRPSRIAVQDVDLVKREGNTLFVRGLDALDHTPVLDIKMQHPYHRGD